SLFILIFNLIFPPCEFQALADYRRRNRHDVLTYREECVKELELPADLVEKFKKLEYPNETETQCYFKCVFSKWELFDNKTGFNVDNIHQQLVNHPTEHSDGFKVTLAGCVDNNEQGSSDCEWAYRGATCLLRENLAE
ncbi:hypothetical protein KR054_010040, partial [Drosophila jambulina]